MTLSIVRPRGNAGFLRPCPRPDSLLSRLANSDPLVFKATGIGDHPMLAEDKTAVGQEKTSLETMDLKATMGNNG